MTKSEGRFENTQRALNNHQLLSFPFCYPLCPNASPICVYSAWTANSSTVCITRPTCKNADFAQGVIFFPSERKWNQLFWIKSLFGSVFIQLHLLSAAGFSMMLMETVYCMPKEMLKDQNEKVIKKSGIEISIYVAFLKCVG